MKKFDIVVVNGPKLRHGQRLVYQIDESFYEAPWGYPEPFESFRVGIRSVQ